MRIRKIVDADASELVELWHATKKAAYPYLPLEQSRTVDDDAVFFRQNLMERCEIWVAESATRLVGFLAIEGSYIDRLYVLPESQRQGVGSALIQHAMALSPTGLELHTHQKNETARSFYEKHGFVAVRFGMSPPPESEPDVEYHWRPRQ